ncbi:MAG: hypothetical protein KC708_23690 [Anaerolineae bacterium]|nr:hypothetical protein [Anaerolineae bacterium]
MARKRKQNRRGLVAFGVLCAIVLLGGLTLWQSGDMQNPLGSAAMLFSSGMPGEGMRDGGFRGGEGGDERFQPPDGENSGERTRPEGSDFEGRGREGSNNSLSLSDIQWDDIGSVFYNLWLMLAATVLVIIIARPIGWLVKQVRSRTNTAAQAVTT